MKEAHDWRRIHDFWFPPGIDDGGAGTHRQLFERWFGGGANSEMPQFAQVLEAARRKGLEHWRAEPQACLSLIIVLDQFPRGLFAGAAMAYACDREALQIAEDGIRDGSFDALKRPWEKTFFLLPLAHAEGPDHLARMHRVVAMADKIAAEAPASLEAIYRFSANQARGNLETISRFGRYPHRNPILGRTSTPDELAYLEKGDFVHRRRPSD